jgi:uncharacterized protein involved in type VI secretion and phage assembly
LPTLRRSPPFCPPRRFNYASARGARPLVHAQRPFPLHWFGNTPSDKQQYPIIAVHHRASNNYQEGGAAVSSDTNQINCVPSSMPRRPGRNFNRVEPKIYGVQTGIVAPNKFHLLPRRLH